MYADLVPAFADLVTGCRCLGCDRGGRLLCPDCLTGLPTTAYVARPTPCPAGLVTVWAAGAYDGLLRELVLGHKEQGLLPLRGPLGLMIAQGVAAAIRSPGPVVLVPVPSRAASVRARGHDPTHSMVRAAAGHLRAVGVDAIVHRLLVIRGTVRDQAGLSVAERADNLAGSLWCPSAGVGALGRRRSRARVVICDDVLTTGATAREAQRALESAGLCPEAVVTVAATARRGGSAPARIHGESSGCSLVKGG
ncbi:Predicted amidophosphoribosyltransferase [metagenome]|uniref:Predicted amidophosphoribosyltransferase n=1 Tax=metagenome TaxID=256318 RepID=A0A2P2CG70_9ZZZZ